MDIRLNSFNIYTANLNSYSNFLSALLEIELIEDSFTFNGLVIRLNEVSKFKVKKWELPVVEFAVDTMDSLEDFKSKYEFFLFRSKGIENKVEIQKNSKEFFIDVLDPDGRTFKFIFTPQR